MQHTTEQLRPYEVKADGLHYACAQAFQESIRKIPGQWRLQKNLVLLCKQCFPQQLYSPSCLFFTSAEFSQFSRICISFIFKKYFFNYPPSLFRLLRLREFSKSHFSFHSLLWSYFLHFIQVLNSQNYPHGQQTLPTQTILQGLSFHVSSRNCLGNHIFFPIFRIIFQKIVFSSYFCF